MFQISSFRTIICFYILFLFLSGIFGFLKGPVFASTTDGTVDSLNKYVWGENIGWLNFGTAEGNVHIADSALTGYAWAENIGWVSLNCSNDSSCGTVDYKVANDGEGTLSGYAWSENTGWINFNPTYGGVTINSSGEFLGYAWGENTGWIVFNCSTTNSCAAVDYKVVTDWRPQSVRIPPSAGGSGGVVWTSPSPTIAYVPQEIAKLPTPEVVPPTKPPTKPIVEKIPKVLQPLVPDFLKPKQPEGPPQIAIEDFVPKEASLAFQGKWQLLPSEPIREFVLAPLPKSIRNLAQKFPELEKTLDEVGISKITDVAKLKSVKLTLPGLTERVGLPTAKVEPGKFALPQGVPVAKLSPAVKQQLPTEIVFAKTGGELVDFNIALSVNDKGEPQQKIQTISGKPLQLVVKPDKPVKSVKGYVVFKSKASRPTSLELPRDSLLASVIFAIPVFAKTQDQPVRVEEKLVLLEFEYTDPDGDGIYTAEIQAPLIEGEYEIITVMDFDDPELGKKEIRLITVVDPEGYIYERDGDKETRIPGAIVSLYWLNPETKQYEMWPAKEYQQENPQTTDVRGTYSFLVPEGYYYLKAETPGYLVYDGKPFEVKEGSGIHINIELKTKYWWLKIVDWKTILLAVVIILLLYNFYRDKIRERLARSPK
ncbi:MAG: carboxypeptidase regulatory-like domain-containing protein [Candidatus Brennerbacteria bacterium]|nr:carboxypeptidase regulatory-like domain-containing protein [Candidatus Brennerbacteria bacterium]